MKQIILKYWAFLLWLVGFVLDSQYQIIEQFGIKPFWCNIIRGLGTVGLAYITNKGLKSTTNV